MGKNMKIFVRRYKLPVARAYEECGEYWWEFMTIPKGPEFISFPVSGKARSMEKAKEIIEATYQKEGYKLLEEYYDYFDVR